MNKNLCQLFVFLALTLSSFMVKAQSDGFENVTLLARIHSIQDAVALSGYAVKLDQESLSHVLAHLEPEDEVLLKGSIRYLPVTQDNKTDMRPTFYISKIIPVSLKRLGESNFSVAEPKLVFSLPEAQAPKGISVTGKVAMAITLTATILLMQNLSTAGTPPGMREKLQSQVFFGAGALATGSFIWDQLQKGTLK